MDTIKLTDVLDAIDQHKNGLIQEVKNIGVKDVCLTRDSKGLVMAYTFTCTGPFVNLDKLTIGSTEANKYTKRIVMDKLVKAYQSNNITKWQNVIK